MKHISELTTELSALYDGLKNGTVDVKVAAELNNTAGKIIHAQRVQLEYAELRKEQPNIDFMSSTPNGTSQG
jgi:adhesin HecA-like repeat protein